MVDGYHRCRSWVAHSSSTCSEVKAGSITGLARSAQVIVASQEIQPPLDFETKEMRVQAKFAGPSTLPELTLWASAQAPHLGFALVDERPAMVLTGMISRSNSALFGH